MAQRPSWSDGTTTITAEQVATMTVNLLRQTWRFDWDGYRYTEADRYRVLLAAAAQHQSLERTCAQLVNAPSANWVRQMLNELVLDENDVETLEAELNDLLWQKLPPGLLTQPLRLALDLTLQPY
ncbi:MAG: hypothetical protein HY329_03610 [Chloroflexi bacterium]|nr:hypothetical protein [Chloroflexota bacterium]